MSTRAGRKMVSHVMADSLGRGLGPAKISVHLRSLTVWPNRCRSNAVHQGRRRGPSAPTRGFRAAVARDGEEAVALAASLRDVPLVRGQGDPDQALTARRALNRTCVD